MSLRSALVVKGNFARSFRLLQSDGFTPARKTFLPPVAGILSYTRWRSWLAARVRDVHFVQVIHSNSGAPYHLHHLALLLFPGAAAFLRFRQWLNGPAGGPPGPLQKIEKPSPKFSFPARPARWRKIAAPPRCVDQTAGFRVSPGGVGRFAFPPLYPPAARKRAAARKQKAKSPFPTILPSYETVPCDAVHSYLQYRLIENPASFVQPQIFCSPSPTPLPRNGRQMFTWKGRRKRSQT